MRKELALVIENEDILVNIQKEISRVLPTVSRLSTRRQVDAVKLLFVLTWNPTTFISEQEYTEEATGMSGAKRTESKHNTPSRGTQEPSTSQTKMLERQQSVEVSSFRASTG